MAPHAPIKLLHLADLHLDRPFVGLPAQDARARRRELREALERCLALAVEHRVDAVTIGGDLWEDEHVTPDTSRWVAHRLGDIDVPVVLVAGNHDPLRPGGPYRRVEWPANVRVLPTDPSPTHPGLQGQEIGPLTVWGISWGAAPLTAQALRDFAAPRDGRVHVLLLHGTAGGAAFEESAHCPFTAALVRAGGFQLCLAGHLHAAGVREEIVVYPGSPEPLAWSETGRHTVAIVE
ncbi:MAG TPA: metallophosphoesterase, partial [Solirubrobacteraceae bacterium]|nr:metallophosphoesterase [Solirubrobacteraceae bacterium]